jgi:GNAT superfamily N-acetyltransferase
MTYTLTRATAADEAIVTEMLAGRVEWLASRGLDQWSAKDPARSTAATIAAGETWLLKDDATGTAVGTLTMTTRPDRDFWHDRVPALYLSKLATRPDRAGEGLGQLLLHAAYLYGHKRQVTLLRWDVWRTNTRLQDYYRGLGGELVDIADVAGRNSGALFQATSAIWRRVYDAGSAQMVTIDATIGVVAQATFDTTHETTTIGHGGDFDDLPPRHWHQLAELFDDAGTPYLFDPQLTGPQVIHHDGDGWHVNTRAVTGALLHPLRPGWPYLLKHRTWFGEHYVEITGDLSSGTPPESAALVGDGATGVVSD